jgi:NAD(P)-dependent dehydrogenase (short-subunit alcohol dehydrogenase family)
MRAGGGGSIINISSGTPFRGVPFLLHYVTSKGAIVAFTRALAKDRLVRHRADDRHRRRPVLSLATR